MTDTTWRLYAACRDTDTSVFFLEREGSTGTGYTEAMALCRTCPVTKGCLEEGLYERHGVWGGKTPNERAKLARERADTVGCAGCGRRLPLEGRRKTPGSPAWCSDDNCRREATRRRVELSRRDKSVNRTGRGVA